MKFFLLIDVKMPTLVAILTFMNGINIAFLAFLRLKNADFLDISILMSIYKSIISCVEHAKSFITSGPGIRFHWS